MSTADKLKSIVVVNNLASGASVVLAHGLAHGGQPLQPDEVKISDPALVCVASSPASITITNNGALAANALVLCEAWHPIRRLFGTPQDGSFHGRLMADAFSIGTTAGLIATQALDWVSGASINSTTGLYTAQVGFVGNPVKNGVGDWTLQYGPALDLSTAVVTASVQDQAGTAVRMNITVQAVDSTHVRVRTFAGGAASDQHFWISISQLVTDRTMIGLAGQSNGEGVADVSLISPANAGLVAAYSPVQYMARVDSNTDPPVFTDIAKEALQPILVTGANRIGIEQTLGRELDRCYPNQWALGKFALGNTSLAFNWKWNGTYPTGQTNLANQCFQWLQAAMVTLGCTRIIIIWVQGESDTTLLANANAYEQNLIDLIALSRTYFPNVQWVIGRLNSDLVNSTSGFGAFTSVVQAAEAAVVAGDPLTALVNMDSVPLGSDHTHYTADGYCTLGYMYAKAVGQLLGMRLRPSASFANSPAGMTFNFTDTSIDHDGVIVSWLWDFGDGNTSTLQNPSHTYAATGVYTVTLTVTDSNGKTDTTTMLIRCANKFYTVDAGSSAQPFPSTAGEWAAFWADKAIALNPPHNLFLCKELGGSLFDVINGLWLLAANGPSYGIMVPGYARTAVGLAENTFQKFASTDASLPDPSVTPMLALAFIQLVSAPASNRTILTFATTNICESRVNATPVFSATSAPNSAAGTTHVDASVRMPIFKIDPAATAVRQYDDLEKLSPVWGGPSGKRFGLGWQGNPAPRVNFLGVALWTGADAQWSDATAKSVQQAFGYAPPWT